jgi:citrate lyase subunit beta/citryl-CoA lyase
MTGRSAGLLAVRVNAIGTIWHDADVAACAANPAVDSIVLPKAEDPRALAELTRHLDEIEACRTALTIQALIESPAGIHHAAALARVDERIAALIIGYADLSASMGRRIDASWQFAQDAVLLAARLAGIQAIDGPLLTIAADEPLRTAAAAADALGFDGKWVIHPAQVHDVQSAFTPSASDVAEAREIIEVLEAAAAAGRGALQWRGRMLDEAVAVRARRTLDRATPRGTHA